ncbi:MAG: serine/threonine protein kinase [Polyangiaceae bacterium]|nr:serine/threonine protein kinase [Myxococcales bacterium]MCB9588957.1 serine/threonine protein kinase [Polyangiaceae bacterium]MCB9609265.1 serine/threonine protein kinase [Polyangiaceae bacterium]
MTAHRADSNDLVGRILGGRYQVKSRINSGGMGVLFEGIDLRSQAPVAIKLLAREFAASPEVVARFELEAHALERVRHPGVVRLLDASFEVGGDAYLVLELLEGESLGDFLHRRGALAADEVVRLVTQIAQGLHAAHRAGVVHRDLKPDNIMLVDGLEQRVKVLDFGICKVKGRPLTRQQVVLGTPDYMSPEQAQGRSGVDAAADQFALGVLAFEMLSGHVPFDADDPMQILYRVVHEPAPDLTAFAPWIPVEVNDVIQRALSKNPKGRFGSVLEFATVLRETVEACEAAFDEDERSSHARIRVMTPDVRRELPTPCVTPSSLPASGRVSIPVVPRYSGPMVRASVRDSSPPPSGVARTEPCPPPVFGDRDRMLASLHLLEDLLKGGGEPEAALSPELRRWLGGLTTFLPELTRACYGLTGRIEYSAPLLHAENVEHAYLLSRLEPGMTPEEAVDVSGLPRERALCLLAELCERGAVRFSRGAPAA